MKKAARYVAPLLMVILGSAVPGWSVRKLVGRIIARVNGEIVTNWEYDREEKQLRQQLSEKYSGAELDAQFRAQSKNLLRDLIDQDLMVQKAKDLDINVDTDLVKRLDEIRKEMHLSTQAELEQTVEKQGMLWEDFEDNIRRHLLMREVIGREVGSRLIVSREDARKYYEAHRSEFDYPEGVRLADVLVSTQNRPPAAAEKRAQEALDRIKAGDRWETVVEKYSDDKQTVDNGGDLGFFKKGTLAPDLSAAIQKVDVGSTTGVLKTQYGYMILKVVQRRQQGIAPFLDVEERVDEILYNQKMQPALRKYLTTLREQSYITLAPGYVDSGAAPAGGLDMPGESQ